MPRLLLHQPSRCPAPSVLTPGAACSQCLPVGEERSPPTPSPRDDATPSCATLGSVGCALCQRALLGGPTSLTRGRCSTGIRLEFSCSEGAGPALSCPMVLARGGAHCLPGPQVLHSDSGSCALIQEKPLCHWLPPLPLPGHCGAQPRGWHWRQVLLPSLRSPLAPTLSTWAQGPQQGNCGLGHNGLAWPEVSLMLGQMPPHLPTQCRPGGQAAQQGGQLGPISVPSAPAHRCAPTRAGQPHSPCPVSATASGCRLAHRMPPRASRAACVVSRLLPLGAGLAHPPLPSTHSPGRFFADF